MRTHGPASPKWAQTTTHEHHHRGASPRPPTGSDGAPAERTAGVINHASTWARLLRATEHVNVPDQPSSTPRQTTPPGRRWRLDQPGAERLGRPCGLRWRPDRLWCRPEPREQGRTGGGLRVDPLDAGTGQAIGVTPFGGKWATAQRPHGTPSVWFPHRPAPYSDAHRPLRLCGAGGAETSVLVRVLGEAGGGIRTPDLPLTRREVAVSRIRLVMRLLEVYAPSRNVSRNVPVSSGASNTSAARSSSASLSRCA